MYNSIYPAYVKSYLGINNRRITGKKDEEKASQSSSSQSAENTQEREKQSQSAGEGFRFPTGEKVAVDYSQSKIHIDKVLTDFKNTANAIGTPPEIRKEVDSYLELIENQAQKDIPNQNIIKSNLKNASQILDDYISKTLNKPSKVVESWVDTLFLRPMEFKSDIRSVPEAVEEQTTEIEASQIESAQEKQAAESVETLPVSEPEKLLKEEKPKKQEKIADFYIPSDPQLKRLFIRGKKYAAIDEKEKAIYAFQNAADYAEEIGDFRLSAMANYEQGKIFDEYDMVEDALYMYNLAVKQTDDNNIKAKAHMSMGKIYDDFIKYEPALNHYSAAVAFSGESDNVKLQAGALSDIARVFSERYDKQNTVTFMDLASTMAEESKDNKTKAVIYGKNAKFCERLDDKAAALNFYGNSAKAYSKINDKENLAKNYVSAAEIMLNYGNKDRARKLLSKAYINAVEIDNKSLITSITGKLGSL